MKIFRDIRVWVALGLFCLTLVVWLVSGMLSAGDPPAPLPIAYRLLLLIVMILAVSALYVVVHLASGRANSAVLEGMEDSSGSDPSKLTSEERQLSQKFKEAAASLKKKKFGQVGKRQHLYQLPWYVVIGSPGSGKTTAIRHSGLDFPLDDLTQGNSLGGVGGTRNCDWWITDQAVLLDTAGRYTTQDSHASHDSGGWKNFLKLLRKNRKKQPINGAIVVISVEELLRMTDQQWSQHSAILTKRLSELTSELQMHFPVYLLVSKVDLLAGCREYFDYLDVEEQDQIWGTTLPMGQGPEGIGGELRKLAARLQEQLPGKLRHERDIRRRQAIYSFPWQMEIVCSRLQNLVLSTFTHEATNGGVDFRGLYFTSAVQEGTPIEKLFSGVSGGFGISSSVSTKTQHSRSLFLKNLFPGIIFQESFLAGINTGHTKNTQRLRLAAFAAIVLAGIGLAVVWTGAFSVHRGLLGESKASLVEFGADQHGPEMPLSQNLLALQSLQRGAQIFDQQEHPWLSNLGMYDSSVDDAAKNAYIRSVKTIIAPSLGGELDQWLSSFSSRDYQQNLNALKAYLMLGNVDRRDDEWLLSWLRQSPLPQLQGDYGELAAQQMQSLFAEIPDYQLTSLNSNTVKRTRAMLAQVSPSEAVFSRLQSDYQSEFKDLTPDLGPYFGNVYEPREPNTLQVPALFTVAGYQTIDFGIGSEWVRGWLDDRWVIGEEGMPSPLEIRATAEGVKQLYARAYIAQWQRLLNDLSMPVPADIDRLSGMLRHLSEPSLSPMSMLLKTVVEQTSLPREDESLAAAQEMAGQAAARATGRLGAAVERVGSKVDTGDSVDVPQVVEDAFAPYRYMTQGQTASKDARVTMEIGDVRQWLAGAASAASSRGQQSPLNRLKLTSEELAPPFSNWVANIAQGAEEAANSSRAGSISGLWRTEVAQACSRAFNGRFPFDVRSDRDASIRDFEAFFAPGGTEQSFVDEYLKPLMRSNDSTLSKGALWTIRQGDRIRDAFFAQGNSASFTYQLTGVEVDDRIGEIVIASGRSQEVRFRHGPPVPLELKWPDGDDGLVVTFMLKDGSRRRKVIGGFWAPFRMVAAGRLSNPGGSVSSQTFSLSDAEFKAIFKVTSDSRVNPFLSGLLDKYQCRTSL